LTSFFAKFNTFGEVDLFSRREERLLSHLPEVQANRIVSGHSIDVANTGVLNFFAFHLEFFFDFIDFVAGDFLLAKLDPKLIQLIQDRLQRVNVISILFEDFEHVLKGDIPASVCPVHEFLYHWIASISI
jgi:hypothetical protein